MSSLEDYYPTPCPFCTIASAYPPSTPSPIPSSPDRTKVSPNCWLLLSTPHVLAFLDILPITPGHILLCPRHHYPKLSDLHTSPSTTTQTRLSHPATPTAQERRETAEAIGRWLPVLSRAVCRAMGVEDWNVVQNNGARAAQVVGHVHFHVIPRGRREEEAATGLMRSWRMFGRGARADLDEEVGDAVAEAVRGALRVEVGEGKARL